MKPVSSDYIDHARREYSIYVLENRAVPHASDGLKASGRRVLWKARDGKKTKTATLAGITMSIHPHDAPEDAINTLTAPYGNNITLFSGEGAFGTILKPNAYGAARYTTVHTSKFTEDAVFKDIEIIPMVPNYDRSEQEPKHFLPLVPLALLNPSMGIAVGFRSSILPRSLEDLIVAQISVLKDKRITEPLPKFLPTDNVSVRQDDRFVFEGDYIQNNATEITINKLPYGIIHEKVIDKIDKLCEAGTVVDYDDYSKKTVDIRVKFKRGVLSDTPKPTLLKMLGLINSETEALVLIGFDGTTVIMPTAAEYIEQFTMWRLQWYVNRYQRLKQLIEADIQRYKDILQAIKKNVGNVAKQVQSRGELLDYLAAIEIVNTDYIADLPVYRFTVEEKNKVENKIKQAIDTLAQYDALLSSEQERRKVYIQELTEILQNFNKGKYQ